MPVNPWTIGHLLNYYIKTFMDDKFLWFRDIINYLGCWKNTQLEGVNHSPATRDLRILFVFYQNSVWFISLQTTETCGVWLKYIFTEKRTDHGSSSRKLCLSVVIIVIDFLKVRFCGSPVGRKTDTRTCSVPNSTDQILGRRCVRGCGSNYLQSGTVI